MTVKRAPVSVIIPVFNGERFIGEALASVRRQTRPPEDILVVDDGSTDGTPGVVAAHQPGIRYVRQANQGPHAAQNTGLGLVRRPFVAFLDADDVWPADKLQVQVDRFSHEPSLEIVLGHIQLFRPRSSGPAGIAPEFEPYLAPFPGHTCFGSALFRRPVFDTVGALNEAMVYGADLDWFLRAREAHLIMRMMDHVCLHYRLHGGNLTRDRRMRNHYLLKVIQNALTRRRQLPGPGGVPDADDGQPDQPAGFARSRPAGGHAP
ncbi:MAG: glycosyltransferase family 2 protein [Acidobacteria bacterium]|nr:glycosyltransferase family 2 protein [Acidobacteriota bacterium]